MKVYSFMLKTLFGAIYLISMPQISSAFTSNAQEAHSYKIVHTKELKSWMDEKRELVILDARPKKYDQGSVLPGAKFLPYDADESQIMKTLPSKDAIIVVYCASAKCPASEYLAEQLMKMNYTHVYRYPEGISDWARKGYGLSKAQ